MEGAANTMATLLESLGTVATETLELAGTVGSTIVSTPILLFTTGILFLGAAVGIFGRLLSKN